MKSIKEVLLSQGTPPEDADELIQEAKDDLLERIEAGDSSAHDICEEYFGLEPDYLMELLP